jgi:hypothetical protein
MESNHRAEEAVRGCGAAAGGAAAASAACRAPVPRVFFLDSAGGGRSGAGAEGGVRASASRFEPRLSGSMETSTSEIRGALKNPMNAGLGGEAGAGGAAAGWDGEVGAERGVPSEARSRMCAVHTS